MRRFLPYQLAFPRTSYWSKQVIFLFKNRGIKCYRDHPENPRNTHHIVVRPCPCPLEVMHANQRKCWCGNMLCNLCVRQPPHATCSFVRPILLCSRFPRYCEIGYTQSCERVCWGIHLRPSAQPLEHVAQRGLHATRAITVSLRMNCMYSLRVHRRYLRYPGLRCRK